MIFNRRRSIFGWWLLAAALAVPRISSACTCSEMEVAEAAKNADVVFAGTVESIIEIDPASDWEPRIVVQFDVARAWKGDVGARFTAQRGRVLY